MIAKLGDMSSSPEPARTLKAAPSTYVVAGVLGAVIVAMMMPPHLTSAKMSDWSLPISFAVLLVAILLLIRVYRIQISEDGVSYRSPLRGVRSVRYQDIERVQTSITTNAGAVPTENRAGPMYRLELYPRATSEVAGRIVINMKIFRLEDIRLLLEVLKKNVSDCKFE
jgi:hypothetical protein